jgi:hypothetical protein
MTQRLPDPEGRQSNRDSSNQGGTSGCNSPPAYESLENLAIMTYAATPTPQKSTNGPEGNDRAPVQHALRYTWSNCEIGQGWGALLLEMALNARHHSGYSGLPWAAGLRVKCRDVPRLMREGFFWSAENILPEEGYMSHWKIPGWSDIGFHHKHVWSLADKSNGETPHWVAQLEVLSHSVSILSSFQVNNLSRENVHKAHAWNAERQLVYHFESQSPRDCYNCIYDDMPLQGWWPWLRPREGWARRGVDVSGPAVEPEDAGDGLPPPFAISCRST